MTDKEIDAMKLALEALELWSLMQPQTTACAIRIPAITAIKQTLKEHAMRETQRLGQEIEQEPYSVQQAYAMAQVCLDLHKAIGCKWGDNVYLAIDQLKVAAHPPQPEQEPVAWLSTDSIGEMYLCFDKPLDNDPVQPLYTAPPQRTWVGLTEQEHTEIAVECGCMSADWVFYGAAVERKLKERNT